MSLAAAQSDAFAAAYERHRVGVYQRCLRYAGGDKGLAEDLAHDVFIRLLEHLPTVDDGRDLAPWLYTVAANLAASRARRDTLFLKLKDVFLGGDEEPAQAPDQGFEEREDADAALRALRGLPGKERVVLCMKLLDGKSQREIAETLSMSEGYVSKLVARGLDRLQAKGWEVGDARA